MAALKCHALKLLQNSCSIRRILLTCARHRSAQTLVAEDSQEVKYPPIKPRYPPGGWGSLTEKWAWEQHDKGQELLAIPAAKERLEAISQEYETYWYDVKGYDIVPRTLEYKQYITKTCLLHGLPSDLVNSDVHAELKMLEPMVKQGIVEEQENHYKCTETKVSDKLPDVSTQNLFWKLLNNLLVTLAPRHEHLLRSQTDDSVRLESFWSRCGFSTDEQNGRGRRKNGIYLFQSTHNPSYQIRTELPLPQFVDKDDDLCINGEVPTIDYSPMTIGQSTSWRKPISVSGHWIGDPCEFGLLSCHVMPQQFYKFANECGKEVADEQVLQYGLTASFSWCLAQAHNQGFNGWLELGYPLTAQTIVSYGRNIRLFAYQLNTIQLWKPDDANPICNICWASPEYELFQGVEDGKVVGFNQDSLKLILQFLLNKPVDRGIDLRPYLQGERAPRDKHLFINHKGQKPLDIPKIGRWQYPRHPVYF